MIDSKNLQIIFHTARRTYQITKFLPLRPMIDILITENLLPPTRRASTQSALVSPRKMHDIKDILKARILFFMSVIFQTYKT